MTLDQLNIFEQDLIGLTGEEAAVWQAVRYRHGKASAVSTSSLALATGLSEKRVQEVVSGLVREHGRLIGSSCQNPVGYYIITDPEELERECRQLRSRAMKCLVRAARLKRTSIEAIFGQAKLEMDGTDVKVTG